jgi:hypothetical protein
MDRKIFLQLLGHALASDVRDQDDKPDAIARAVREALVDLIDEYHRPEIITAVKERMKK